MSTYRIQAGALLRLATIAGTSAEGDPAEILAIVQGAELEEDHGSSETLDHVIQGSENTIIHGGGIQTGSIAVPPAKPEE